MYQKYNSPEKTEKKHIVYHYNQNYLIRTVGLEKAT